MEKHNPLSGSWSRTTSSSITKAEVKVESSTQVIPKTTLKKPDDNISKLIIEDLKTLEFKRGVTYSLLAKKYNCKPQHVFTIRKLEKL